MICLLSRERAEGRNHTLLILSVFLATYFIYTDFNIRQFLGFGVLCVLLLFDLKNRIILTETRKTYIVLVVSVLLFFMMPNAKHDKDTISYIMTMLIGTVYLLFTRYDSESVNKALWVFQAMGICFMAVLLLFRINPNLYWSYVHPFLSAATQEEASIYIRKGYSIPIAGGYTYVNHMFALAFIVSISKIFAGKIAKREKRKTSLWTYTVACSSILGMVLTGRRSELISLIAVFGILKLIYKQKITYRKFSRLLIVLPLAVFAVAAMLVIFNGQNFLYRYINTYHKILNSSGAGLQAIFGGSHDITSGRVELWGIAAKQFAVSPLWGIGWFRFGEHVPAAFSAVHGRELVTNVHNDYLQRLCESGIIGATLMLIPTFYLLFIAWKQAKRIKSNPCLLDAKVCILNISTLGIQLYYALLSLIDPCFYSMLYWSFYTVAIIFLELALQLEKENMRNPIESTT